MGEMMQPVARQLVMGFVIFAFAISFIRELVKDMEDVEGDRHFNSKTLPIVIGVKNARFVTVLLILALTGLTFFIQQNLLPPIAKFLQTDAMMDFANNGLQYTCYLLYGMYLLTAWSIVTAENILHYRRTSTILKITMIIGTLSMLAYSIEFGRAV